MRSNLRPIHSRVVGPVHVRILCVGLEPLERPGLDPLRAKLSVIVEIPVKANVLTQMADKRVWLPS